MPTSKRQYPYVQSITDHPTATTIRLLWDKAFDQEAALTTAQATIAQQTSTIAALQTSLTIALKTAQEALITAGQAVSALAGGGGSGGGGNTPTNCPDDGQGAQGCATRGADGHVAPGTPLTAVTAGQIVCGTSVEWMALAAPTANQPDRDANQLELLLRIIWHLNLAGFTAGRQRNPSGVISGDKITVQVSGVFLAYDVFQGVSYSTFLPTQMIRVCPADYVVEGGTPD